MSNIIISWFLPPINLVFSPWDSCSSWKKKSTFCLKIVSDQQLLIRPQHALCHLYHPEIWKDVLLPYVDTCFWSCQSTCLIPGSKSQKWECGGERRRILITKCNWGHNSPQQAKTWGQSQDVKEELWSLSIVCIPYTQSDKDPISELLNESLEEIYLKLS